jgi:hypothetical protein
MVFSTFLGSILLLSFIYYFCFLINLYLEYIFSSLDACSSVLVSNTPNTFSVL